MNCSLKNIEFLSSKLGSKYEYREFIEDLLYLVRIFLKESKRSLVKCLNLCVSII